MPNSHTALIIDDNEEVLQALRNMLDSLGHRYHCASTQEEADRLLNRHGVCYVLLDLELPVRSNQLANIQVGFNLLEHIRARFTKDQLPIIVMTAHGKGHEYTVRAFKMGCTDYIKKAFDEEPEPLEDKIREAMQQACEQQHRACPNTGTSKGGRPKSAAPPKGKRGESWAYRTQHKFHFNGGCRRRRYLIHIDGREAWVRGETFTCLWKLAVRLCNHPPGWLHRMDFHENVDSAIYRMKQELAKAGLDGDCIENDGHGQFRLSTPPQNITYDEEPFRATHPTLFEEHTPKHR